MTAGHIADHVVVVLPFDAGARFGHFTKQQVSHRRPAPILFRLAPPARKVQAGGFAGASDGGAWKPQLTLTIVRDRYLIVR
jgi:hypothetical protein